jgi:carbamoyl-phosphate synthase large subunit
MNELNSGPRVLVTGVGGGGIGEQILKALRLAPTRYEIVGCDASPQSTGLLEVDHPYIAPAAREPSYVSALIALCKKHQVRAVFPGSEPELRVISENRAAFEAEKIFLPINPHAVIETCLDKDKTATFLASHGFASPRSVRIDEEADLARVDFFPAVVKPYLGGGGSSDVTIAQYAGELRALAKLLLLGGRKLMVQEYVGTPEAEYTVGVLTGMDGRVLHSIALRRFILSALGNRLKTPNRTGRAELGPTLAISSGISQGEIGPFPAVTKPCEEIAAALGSRGPLNIQVRFVAGKVYVFEINPRFSGTTCMRAMVGYNEPDVLLREHLGERVEPRFPYRSGTILRGLHETLLEPREFPKAVDLL